MRGGQRDGSASGGEGEALQKAAVGLPPEVRLRMEEFFGCDLGHVRIHSDPQATASARRFGAEAYTTGHDIVFAEGRYRPDTREGTWLLAHELTHVVQQTRAGTAGCGGRYEEEADWCADAFFAGKALGRGFALSAAPFGRVQCHVDAPCPGNPVSARPEEIYMPANHAIERRYKTDQRNAPHENGILVGSDFDRGEIRLPRGAPNQRFGNMLLARLRGISRQRRPDIIDFVSRVIYEIKPAGRARQGSVQLASYYALTDEIRREYAGFQEPPWRVEYATWYPPHVLSLDDATLTGDRIVCTQATDHQRWPGLLLYDVRQLDDDEKRKRRMRQAVRFEVGDFDRAFGEYWPTIRQELRRAVRVYDPYDPEYVIIVPQPIYWARYREWNDQQLDKFYRVKPSYDFPGGHEIEGARRILLIATGIVAIAGAVGILITAGAVLAAPAAGGAAAAGAASAGGGAEIISLAAYRAMLAAPQVKTLAAAAGVLLVFGAVSNADAASARVDTVSAVRAVAVADFRRLGGPPSASSTPQKSKFDAGGTCPNGFGKDFAVGSQVLFDGLPHYVIGQLTAQ